MSARVGHSSTKITMDVYAHLFEEVDQDAVEAGAVAIGLQSRSCRFQSKLNLLV